VPGVTTSLSAPSASGSETVDLTVSATASIPGATFQVVVTGRSGNLTQALYVTLGPPGFFLLASRVVYLDQATQKSIAVGVNPLNGFQDTVDVVVRGNLASGVTTELNASQLSPSDPPLQLTLAATAQGTTGIYDLALSGHTDGGLTDLSPLFLALSAATGDGGQGVPVDLSAAYNMLEIASDGLAFGQLDGGPTNNGYAYSANLLGPARILSGVQFVFGPADQLDVVSGTGQSLPLPTATFTTLWLAATGIYGRQEAQEFSVGYTDGTSDTFTQDLSDWDFPQDYRGEVEAVLMPYRNLGDGTRDSSNIQNIYAYSFPLDPTKVVESLTLPTNPNVIVQAVTLTGREETLDAGTNPPSDGGLTDSDAGVKPPPDAGTEGNDAGVETAPAKGCGCSQGAGDPALLGLGLIGLAYLRRRRGKRSA
jgi:MYXO-CTERM domain-containing protein